MWGITNWPGPAGSSDPLMEAGCLCLRRAERGRIRPRRKIRRRALARPQQAYSRARSVTVKPLDPIDKIYLRELDCPGTNDGGSVKSNLAVSRQQPSNVSAPAGSGPRRCPSARRPVMKASQSEAERRGGNRKRSRAAYRMFDVEVMTLAPRPEHIAIRCWAVVPRSHEHHREAA